jgi:hypothetical protein
MLRPALDHIEGAPNGDEAPSSRTVAVPGMGEDVASREPKPKALVNDISANGTEAAGEIVAAPGIVQTDAPEKPNSSGTTAAAAFLRGALAQGPLDVKEIERRAVKAGLLEENMPIGKSKIQSPL